MTELQVQGQLLGFDEDKREVEVLIVPWDQDVDHDGGVHRFARGAFEGVDPKRFVFRSRHLDPPTGRAFKLEDQDDGQHGWFRISKTVAGDEQLTLIRDGVEDGISVGFSDSVHTKERLDSGRTRYTHTGFQASKSLEASTTWRPTFPEARVIAFQDRSSDHQEDSAVADEPTTTATEPAAGVTPEMIQAFQSEVTSRFEAMQDRIAAIGLTVPDSLKREQEEFSSRVVLGSDLMEPEVRTAFAIDDVISADNLGVIPEMRSSRIIGIIDSSRPFLSAMTREPTPPAGEVWRVPKITQRPEVGLQSAEKAEVASQKTVIGSVTFNMKTYAGAGDLSIQLIKRSDPSFLALWTDLLGEAYAIATDDAGLDALLAEAAVVEGGALDPSSPSFGGAFQNAATAAGSRPALLPNRLLLSTAGLVAFIDAKSPTGGGGTPLYPGLAGIAGITGGNGSGPAGFQMQPVWVPAMDDEAVDVIVGPSQGFRWTEDGTYTLTADVPDKAGRDVGIVGMIWFAPVYPAAFTSYTLAS